MKLHLVSLGCDKNLVDSEGMLGQLVSAGYETTPTPEDAEIIIINTCSFIEPAINESIDTILELARFKTEGSCHRLIVAGCLPERFRETIINTLPEVDVFLGTGAFDKIISAVAEPLNDARCHLPHPDTTCLQNQTSRRMLTSQHLAYIKIAEGCDHRCAFCGIRMFTGDGHTVVEAAHIIPWAISYNDDPRNGLALCRLCHWAFDEGLMGVTGRYTVLTSRQLSQFPNLPGHLAPLTGRGIFLPAEDALAPDRDALAWHRRKRMAHDE